MGKTFKRGDRVSWNSEAGRVRGVILRKATSSLSFKGYVHHASKAEPQYFIKSEKTGHVALHKGGALRLIGARAKAKTTKPPKKRTKHR